MECNTDLKINRESKKNSICNLETQQLCWLRLHQLRLTANLRTAVLQAYHHQVEQLFAATPAELAANSLPPKLHGILHATYNQQQVAAELQWSQQCCDRHLIVWGDADYPKLLREIADPPVVLFGLGDRDCLTHSHFSIVGSRAADTYGCKLATEFAGQLSEIGFCIVSGLARGIDIHAHKATLLANGNTIAVLGNGLLDIYPRAHRRVARQIADSGGLLLSELPLSAPPLAAHFPLRNRIISGLSVGVLLVQAAQRSGSLITARHALEQNREVFAIPGSIYSRQSQGCHWLLRQGAKLVEEISDIMSELENLVAVSRTRRSSSSGNIYSSLEQNLLQQMGSEPLTVEELIMITGLSERDISTTLLHLELKGAVGSFPGARYLKVIKDENI